MIDFIKSINLSEDLKNDEIYNFFKTDSSQLNLSFLSNLQNFHKTKELLNFYTNQDCQNAFDIFNSLFILSSKICEESENNLFKSETDKYLSDISKIIFLFSLIQKNNELLSNLINNTKKFLKKFYLENPNKVVKEKLNNCINDLMSSSQIASQRNYSRRSTKENTISPSSMLMGHNLTKLKQFDMNLHENNFLLFQCHTPKFEEDEDEIIEVNEEQSCYNNINLENMPENLDNYYKRHSKKSIETIGSSLSFKQMKFVYEPDNYDDERTIKKNKTLKMGVNFSNPKNFFKKKSLSNKVNEDSLNNDSDSENNLIHNIDKTKILAKFLNIINNLFKKDKINSEQKLAIKQLIISDSDTIIKKYIEYNISNKYFDKKFIDKYIKKFLLEQIKNME